MNIEAAIKIVNEIPKGKQFTIIMGKTILPKKTSQFVGKITKVSTMKVRLVDYEAQQAVQEKRNNGMEKRPNNWERIANGIYLDHNGKFKLCVAASKLKNQKNSSDWFVDGKPVKYDEIESVLLANDKKNKQSVSPDWFTPNVENLLEILH